MFTTWSAEKATSPVGQRIMLAKLIDKPQGLIARVLEIWVQIVDISLLLVFCYALMRILVLRLLPEAATSRGRHQLVQLHKPSNRMNLYLGSHAYQIDGWSRADSKPVIEALMRHASQDKYVLTVDWQNNGDMIMWVCIPVCSVRGSRKQC